jgi:hypothetical protein
MQPVRSNIFSPTFEPQKVKPIAVQETGRAFSLVASPFVIGSAKAAHSLSGRYRVETSTEVKLFSALAEAKVWTSRVSMHLGRETRDRIFRQLDLIHDPEEWFEGDKPVALSSYKTFIRAIVFHDINCRPALSVMPNGNVLALWQDGADKLTIEFLPENRTRWLVQSESENGPERASGSTPLERLRQVLAPYGATRWFDGR